MMMAFLEATLNASSSLHAQAPAAIGLGDQSERAKYITAILVAGFLSALTVKPSIGQVRPTDQTPTFRVRTDVVQLDVLVLDRQGQPVRGLTAGDFTVLEVGRSEVACRCPAAVGTGVG